MLLFGTVCIISLNLIINAQIAQSYMLLTATMEDIKKIAKKFVSESLADQIAEFIAKANVDNISKENEMNAKNVQELSSESISKGTSNNKPRNEKKHVKIKKPNKKEHVPSSSKETKDQQYDLEINTRQSQWAKLTTSRNENRQHKDSKSQHQAYQSIKYNNREKIGKTEQQNSNLKHNRIRNDKHVRQSNNFEYNVPSYDKPEQNNNDFKYIRPKITKQWYELPPKIETSTLRENIVNAQKHNQNRFKIKSKSVFKTADAKSCESKQNKNYNGKDKSIEIEATTGYSSYDVDRASVEMTTERRQEIDIDYNGEYSKKYLIATSGPVRLKKVNI